MRECGRRHLCARVAAQRQSIEKRRGFRASGVALRTHVPDDGLVFARAADADAKSHSKTFRGRDAIVTGLVTFALSYAWSEPLRRARRGARAHVRGVRLPRSRVDRASHGSRDGARARHRAREFEGHRRGGIASSRFGRPDVAVRTWRLVDVDIVVNNVASRTTEKTSSGSEHFLSIACADT